MACAYCKDDTPAGLVRCRNCDQWLCNSKSATQASHIVLHLVKNHHSNIALHKTSLTGESPLECYCCRNPNVFSLGYIPADGGKTVVLICRLPCALAAPSLLEAREGKWETKAWKPLVHEGHIAEWLVTHKAGQKALNITTRDVIAIEGLRSQQARDQVRDAVNNDQRPIYTAVPTTFSSKREYRDLFYPLIQAEAVNGALMEANQLYYDVHIDWVSPTIITFVLPYTSAPHLPGTRVLVECPVPGSKETYKASATVVRAHNEQITARLAAGTKQPLAATGFFVRFEHSLTTSVRIQKALELFATSPKCVGSLLRQSILATNGLAYLGGLKGRNLGIKLRHKLNSREFNQFQIAAGQRALDNPITLIQGPPGTGKTSVTLAIGASIALSPVKTKVLICAPSNVVVDHVTLRLIEARVDVVRIISASREVGDPVIKRFTLNYKVRESLDMQSRILFDRHENGESLSEAEEQCLQRVTAKAEHQVLAAAKIVCCTCAGAGQQALAGFNFPIVIVDESTQTVEPACMIPMVHRCEKLILVGDHKQLGPVVTDREVAKAGLKRSLFERFLELGQTPSVLQMQYRMHPALCRFPSSMFYDGSLQNARHVFQRAPLQKKLSWLWPSPENPTLFWTAPGEEELGENGTSYINRLEAFYCRQLVTRMIQSGVNPEEIAIITPYVAQRAYLQQYLLVMGELTPQQCELIEIESVDGFQGREKQFVILSCVRSDIHSTIGFLQDQRRLNVSITRAQFGLVIIGNARCLSRERSWRTLIEYYREGTMLVEGHLDGLRPSNIPLMRAKPEAVVPVPLASAMESVSLENLDEASLLNKLKGLS